MSSCWFSPTGPPVWSLAGSALRSVNAETQGSGNWADVTTFELGSDTIIATASTNPSPNKTIRRPFVSLICVAPSAQHASNVLVDSVRHASGVPYQKCFGPPRWRDGPSCCFLVTAFRLDFDDAAPIVSRGCDHDAYLRRRELRELEDAHRFVITGHAGDVHPG